LLLGIIIEIDKLSRILYIEDESSIWRVAELALEIIGEYTVKTRDSGYEALKFPIFNTQLILLDVT
jgi:CheY-like chemotaxis protein